MKADAVSLRIRWARPILAALALTYCFVLQLTQWAVPTEMWGLTVGAWGWLFYDRSWVKRHKSEEVEQSVEGEATGKAAL